MKLSMPEIELKKYIAKQLNVFFPDLDEAKASDFDDVLKIALDRYDGCFAKMRSERFRSNNETIFNHLYSDQYLVFLWFISNTIWNETKNSNLATKIYYLNKTMHSFDCMYDTKLPDVFYISHGIGTMLGKANYSDYLVVMQGCTVGSSKGMYPTLGKGVALTAHSSVIGNCTIGDDVTISSYANIYQRDIPSKSLVFRNADGSMEVRSSEKTFSNSVFDF